MRKDVNVAHLAYKVRIRPRGKLYPQHVAYATRDTHSQTTIYIDDPASSKQLGVLVHELIHALQYIARDRHLDFVDEMEHFAYIADFILAEVRGFERFKP